MVISGLEDTRSCNPLIVLILYFLPLYMSISQPLPSQNLRVIRLYFRPHLKLVIKDTELHHLFHCDLLIAGVSFSIFSYLLFFELDALNKIDKSNGLLSLAPR